jgi:hypothetical protein
MAGPITKALSGRKKAAAGTVSRAFASMTPDEQRRFRDAIRRSAELIEAHFLQHAPPTIEAVRRAMERIANRGTNPEAR